MHPNLFGLALPPLFTPAILEVSDELLFLCVDRDYRLPRRQRPDNVSLLILPPYSPELNPIERIWLYLRERHLLLRLLDSNHDIVNACCAAWNKLTTERLKSLTSYPYLEQVRC